MSFARGRSKRKDERLMGTWRSDKERTLGTWKWKATSTPDGRARVSEWFGKLTYRYTEDTVYGEFEDQKWSTPYWVIESGENYVVTGSREGGKLVEHRIFIDKEHIFWTTSGGNVEYFRRVEA